MTALAQTVEIHAPPSALIRGIGIFSVNMEPDEITRLRTEDARRTLGIVALSLALSMGKHHPARRKPSSNEDRA
jgi:hypothetical protein